MRANIKQPKYDDESQSQGRCAVVAATSATNKNTNITKSQGKLVVSCSLACPRFTATLFLSLKGIYKDTLSAELVSSRAGVSSPDDVVIVSALRTPICKAKRGDLKDTPPDLLLISVLKATMDRTGVKPSDIGDIVVGNVLMPGAGAVTARIAQLEAGIPFTVPLSVVSRQCSSGLQVREVLRGHASVLLLPN